MTKRQIVLNVNGRDHEVWVAPSDTVLDVLHDELGLADVRYGCGAVSYTHLTLPTILLV